MSYKQRLEALDPRQRRSLYRSLDNSSDSRKPTDPLSKSEFGELIAQIDPPAGIKYKAAGKFGTCRMCDSPIVIPGGDAYKCSHPSKACGHSGWVWQLWEIDRRIAALPQPVTAQKTTGKSKTVETGQGLIEWAIEDIEFMEALESESTRAKEFQEVLKKDRGAVKTSEESRIWDYSDQD